MTEELHRLLQRQLRQHGVAPDSLPPSVDDLLGAIDRAYREADADRLQVERSLELSSQELLTANAEMRALFEALPDVILKSDSAGKILDSRPAHREVEGLPIDPLHCDSLEELFGVQATEVLQALRRVDESGTAESVQVRFETPTKPWTFEVRIVPMTSHEHLVVLRDSTDRVAAEEALRASEERFRSLVQNSSDMIVIVSAQGRAIYASPAVERIMGYEEHEWRDMDVLSLIHPGQVEDSAESLRAVMVEPGMHPSKDLLLRHRDGSYRWIEMTAHNLLAAPPVSGIIFNARDVTEHKQAEDALRESEERFRSLVQNASDLFAVIDPDTKVLYGSPSMRRVLGDQREDLGGRTLTDLVHPDDLEHVVHFLSELANSRRGAAPFEARFWSAGGVWRTYEFVGTDQRHNPAISGYVLNARDVTERRDLEEQLRHQAFHDALTGLANRARFGDRLEHALERAARGDVSVTLLFMDIDDFKAINDGLGHSIGDLALQHVASLLQDALREGDTIARLGGDEFAVLVEDASLDEAVQLAERILDSLTSPLKIDEDDIFVRASIGIAVSHGKEFDADGLLRNADVAMYSAKEAGKGRYEVYRASMRSGLLERLALQRDMQHAIDADEFVVEYQPLVDLVTTEIVGFEALVRWQHPRLGLLQPIDFISLAEESGLIIPLGHRVLSLACAQGRAWQEEFPHDPPRTMSVNVSVKELQREGFLSSLLATLSKTGLDPRSLTLEVTETVMLQDAQSTIALLQAIRSHGVRVAIDDFGTGYSSLSYLSRLPFDILKIDKTFVDQSRRADHRSVLIRAIVDLGRTFSVDVVAEGIEDENELDRLRQLHCDIGQGFYFAAPGDVQRVSELLRQEPRSSHAA